MQLDETDRRILRHALAEPSALRATLAERAGVTPATLWRRLERLQAGGVLRGEAAVIDWRKLGFGVEVSLRFTLDKTDPRAFDQFIEAARLVPEVLAIETFLGRVDVRLIVIARDIADFERVLRRRIMTLPGVGQVEANVLLTEERRPGPI